jgi:hypothetical protein
MCLVSELNETMRATVDCADIETALAAHTIFWPNTFINGTFYDTFCVAQHGNGTDNTLPPLCDCDESTHTCVRVNCSAQCPGRAEAVCNTTTHLCECAACPPDDGDGDDNCTLIICHVDQDHGFWLEYVPVTIDCSDLAWHLDHGDALPNSFSHGVFVNASCVEVPNATLCGNTSCTNDTIILTPICDCDADNCTLLSCDNVCAQPGGSCNTTTHLCECLPSPESCSNYTAGGNCTNGTTTIPVPLCDCVPEWGNCTVVDCNEQCPLSVSASCNTQTHVCECGECPTNDTTCKILICHRDHGHPNFTLNSVNCDAVPAHLAQHGDFFPGSVFNATTMFDANCSLVPLPTCANGTQNGNCTNTTTPPLPSTCDCNPNVANCTVLDCDAVCAAPGGECNTTTHLCECLPSPESCSNYTTPGNCTNNTVIKEQQCDCNENEDGTCLYVDPNVQCPPNVSAQCNSETHMWQCGACPTCDSCCDECDECDECDSCCDGNGNNTVPCTLTMCLYNASAHRYARTNVSCANVTALLNAGNFFPDALVNGTALYDTNCTLVPQLPCTNNHTGNCSQCNNHTTPPPCPKIPRCDCDAANCTLVDCDTLCPNGGECDAQTHECVCLPCLECPPPCPPAPEPTPVCGNGIVDQRSEECDGGLFCLANCTLPRAWPYCTALVCDPLAPDDLENPPNIIQWFTEHCRCGNATRPRPTPDELRDECGDYNQTVVCPANLYDTSGLGTWAAVVAGLLFSHVVLAYAGSFL